MQAYASGADRTGSRFRQVIDRIGQFLGLNVPPALVMGRSPTARRRMRRGRRLRAGGPRTGLARRAALRR
jgi:hypothetical protein